jgi:serine/threonine protein kinase
VKCPHCQTENSEKAKFCRGCGQPLQTEVICDRCQHKNVIGSRFCEQCGQPLIFEKAPSPATSEKPSPQPTFFAGGRYQVKKFLGEGGKKKVYLAHDNVLDRDVAFALIKTEKLDKAARTRITREAQAMGRLGDHPHIVTVYDFGDHEGQPYMVLPLLPGGDVEGLIEKAPEHKLPLDKAIEIAKCVCKGLEFAHSKGIIHRDLKPGNVWLSADGTAKIGDFGLAMAVDLSRLTQSGMMVGTVSYMPPEQAMGGQVTEQADFYALGSMLYEMVTGRPPFIGDDSVAIIGQHINTPPVSPTWHRADLPPALETLILQLLEKNPRNARPLPLMSYMLWNQSMPAR